MAAEPAEQKVAAKVGASMAKRKVPARPAFIKVAFTKMNGDRG
jgi:hypothetical protein